MEWKKIVGLGIFIFLLVPSQVFGQSPSPGAGTNISLSEVFACYRSDGAEDNKTQWIELYNKSDAEVSLEGWKLEKNTSTTKETLTGMIPAKGYFRIALGTSSRGFFDKQGYAFKLIDPADDTIESFPSEYKNDSTKTEKCVADSALSSWIKQGETWAQTTSVTPRLENVNTPVATPTPSPTSSPSPTPKPSGTPTPTSTPSSTAQPTSSPTPGSQPTTVKLSEVYACQEDGLKEWVELSNSGSSAVTLTNWKLIDADSNDQPIASLTIPAKGYAVVEISKYPKGMFTNTGDTVKLLNATGTTVDTMSYASCSQTTSQSFNGSQWAEGEISKGTANSTLVENTPAPTPQEETEDTSMVLGTSVEEDPTPLPTSTPSKQSSSNLLAFGGLGTGITMLAGTLGYFGYDYWKKSKGLLKAKHA